MDHNQFIGQDGEIQEKLEKEKKKDKDMMMGCLAVIAILFVLTPLSIILGTLWEGYILSVLWNWFVVKIGMPPLTIMLAFGIAITIKPFIKGFQGDKVVDKWMRKKTPEEKESENDISRQVKRFVLLNLAHLTIVHAVDRIRRLAWLTS